MGAGKSSAGEALAARLGWRSSTPTARSSGRPAGRSPRSSRRTASRRSGRSRSASSGGCCTRAERGAGARGRVDPVAGHPRAAARRAASPCSWTSRRRRRGGGSRPMPATGRSRSRRAGSPSSTSSAARSTTPTCDALVDAEELQGEEALLAPLARPAALAELPRLVGARRAALIADRAVLRVLGPPIDPLVTVRLPAGEAAKTVAVARQAWTRLADLGVERGDVVVGARRRRGDRRRRVRGGDLPARRPLDLGADVAHRDGGRRHRREDGRRSAPGQERRRRLPPAGVGRVRPGDASRRCRCASGRPGSPRW